MVNLALLLKVYRQIQIDRKQNDRIEPVVTKNQLMPHTTIDNWQHLKDAIARSSGFERWWRLRYSEVDLKQRRDEIIVAYLRETLDTLAY